MGVSLDAQRDRLRAYGKQQGIELIDIKADEGLSGSTLLRPGLQAALAMLQRGRARRPRSHQSQVTPPERLATEGGMRPCDLVTGGRDRLVDHPGTLAYEVCREREKLFINKDFESRMKQCSTSYISPSSDC